MISSKSLIADISDVPVTWAFEFYLKLPEKLCGQDIKIKSPFNPKDKIPSCNVYWNQKSGRYKFKDFSTGVGGDCCDLVEGLFNLKKGAGMYRVIEDYNQFILDNKGCYNIAEFKEQSRYKVTSVVKRHWNTLDRDYWMKYGLGSKILEHYGVYPLESYALEKDKTNRLTISGYHIYGYFRSDGVPYKIYQPKVKERKFIKIRDYIQGTDQLKFEAPILVICSSLKDLACLMNYRWNMEAVAPDSENTLIPEHIIQAYKHKYKLMVTLFDNDEPGIKAMKKYKEKYNIPYAILEKEKDLSDTIAKYRKEAVGNITYDLIYNALETNLKLI